MDGKKIKFKKLLILYFLIVLLTAVLVGPPHLFAQPYFMPLRFPHYLEMMPNFLGFSWPMTFEVYHWVLMVIATIGAINVLGILYSKFKQVAIISSFIGLSLFFAMALFFFFKFINVNVSTAVIYGSYSVVLLITDWITFKVFVKN